MTKEELKKYARENRKRLDKQEVKLGDVVKVLVGQFAGETGVIVSISACRNDYTDPYYEADMNCEVPDKYKCRKTLITPNNVIGGLSATDFEVIDNRAHKQPSMEIKQGDKVRVSKDAPRMYFYGCNHDNSVFKVILVDRDNAEITQIKNGSFAIPTKYLIKVDAEAKEPKFKKGDKVRFKGVYTVESVDDGQVFIDSAGNSIDEDCLEPYTEPTEQTEAEKKPNVGSIKIPVEVDLSDSYWDAYTADLAKEIAVKVANKYSDPEQAAEYAVQVAKAVVEGLKGK